MKCTPNHTMSAALGASWTFLLCELNHSFLVSNLLVSCLMPFKLFWYRLLLCPNTVRALGICISSIYLQQNPSSRSRSKTLSQGAMHWPESCLPATALWATGGELPCLFLQTLPEATLFLERWVQGNSPVVRWLGLGAFTAKGLGSLVRELRSLKLWGTAGKFKK